MIKFKRILYKNFLSVGDQGNIIDLDKTLTTVITGENGAGKSTFIDALVYALFGKPFRKVRLGQLVNNVNEKGLIVDIEFSIGSKQYIVKRGMKPSIFEIWVDGEMIPQPAETKDYQSILEGDILKLNYKSFTQIIVLGSASFKPFMQQKLAVRREIIEDLLDISVFSQMNTLLKSKIKEAKSEIIDVDHKLSIKKEQYSSKRTYLLEANDDHKKRISVVNDNILEKKEKIKLTNLDKDSVEHIIIELEESIFKLIDVEDKIKLLNKQYTDIEKQLYRDKDMLAQYHKDNNIINDANKKISDCEKRIIELIKKRKILDKIEKDTRIIINSYDDDISDQVTDINTKMILLSNDIIANEIKLKFYKDNESCPECKQDIEQLFREDFISDLTSIIDKGNEDYNNYKDKIDKIKIDLADSINFIKKLNKTSADIQIIDFDIDKLKNSIDIINESISLLDYKNEKSISDKEHDISLLLKEIDDSNDKINQYTENYNKLLSLRKKLNKMQQSLALIIQSIDNYTINHDALVIELKELKSIPACSITQEDIDSLAIDIKSFDKSLDKKKHMLHYFGIVQRLLKDDGLKTKIIKKFLPVINATVNMYLDKFDFPINFEFDENFNETIQSKFRSDFSYYSFSEGEKSRIDLALLFTWRETSLKKSRNATNIIIFDEIFDGSLDGGGIENFMDILGLDKEGYSSFIISHKDETINSRFDRTLDFNKDGHFSKMMEK